MEYKELKIEITPFNEEFSEILIAMIEDLGFESYNTENPFLYAYIQESLFDKVSITETLESLDFPDFKFSWSFNDVKQENWNAQWESSFEPVVIEGKCTIKATYHTDLAPTPYTITINPEMAFGTGHHQTTTLMASALIDNYTGADSVRDLSQLKVLDMGCGTGILSFLSAMIGAKKVTAIDIDETAKISAIENAKLNNVSHIVDVHCGDASILSKFEKEPFDIILANINRNILINDMHIYSSVLKAGGELYLSGFYEEDILLLVNEANKYGLELLYTKSIAPWAVIKLKKL